MTRQRQLCLFSWRVGTLANQPVQLCQLTSQFIAYHLIVIKCDPRFHEAKKASASVVFPKHFIMVPFAHEVRNEATNGKPCSTENPLSLVLSALILVYLLPNQRVPSPCDLPLSSVIPWEGLGSGLKKQQLRCCWKNSWKEMAQDTGACQTLSDGKSREVF